MKVRLHYLQHVDYEDPANIGVWAARRGHSMAGTHIGRGEALPRVDSFDWLVIMGGPMSVYEEDHYDWLRPEKQLIGEAIEAGKAVIGVCLGAQLLAEALGARVYAHTQSEIGFFDVDVTAAGRTTPPFDVMPPRFPAFHWHGDTFDIPVGATHLAASAVCPNQAFIAHQRLLGLQFHVETTRPSAQAIIDHSDGMLVAGGPAVQTAERMMNDEAAFETLPGLLDRMLDRFAAVAGA